MRIIACLSWYDEQPAHLTELVASLSRIGVTHLTAVDGAYSAYPNAKPRSGPAQARAITRACATHHIACTLHQPAEPWAGNELQKRTFLFKLAHTTATPHEDWLLVTDADELWTVDPGAPTLQQQLAATSHHVAIAHVQEYVDPEHTNRDTARKAFRAHPLGIRVHGAHYIYVNGDNQVLWGVAGRDLPATTLQGVHVTHRPAERRPQRLAHRGAYYQTRTHQKLEASTWEILHSAW